MEREQTHSTAAYVCMRIASGHLRASFPTRPSRTPVRWVQFQLCHQFRDCGHFRDQWKGSRDGGMIDSGAAGKFYLMDHSQQKVITSLSLPVPLTLAVAARLDGRPLGSGSIPFTTAESPISTGLLHTEIIRLFVFQSPQNPIILGLPWLEQHNPSISWAKKQITQWSDFCLQNCLPQHAGQEERWDLLKWLVTQRIPRSSRGFQQGKGITLTSSSSQRLVAIDLLPGSQPPKGRVSRCHNLRQRLWNRT